MPQSVPCRNCDDATPEQKLSLDKIAGKKITLQDNREKNVKHNVQQKGHDDSVELNKTRPVQILASGHEVVKW